MQTENITIANLSYGGCISTVTKKLSAIAGVETVTVHLEINTVTVNHNEAVNRNYSPKHFFPLATQKQQKKMDY